MGAALHQVIGASGPFTNPNPQGHLRLAVLVILALGLALPILASLWQTLRAAFGVLPVFGQTEVGLAPWRALAETPGLLTALRLSLVTGFASTALSLVLALAFVAALPTARPKGTARLLAPFLAMPHAAMAVGLAFVLAPSGWIARALAPMFDWTLPPDVASISDPYGAALIVGLVIKEMPFLALAVLAATTQIPLRQSIAEARSLGYGRGAVWTRIIFPQIWPLIRLPVYIVLAFGLSVIDMAIILGPSNPPTFAVLLARLFTSPDLAQLLPASAGAIALLAVVSGSFVALFLCERVAAHLGRLWIFAGQRSAGPSIISGSLASLAAAMLTLGALGTAALALWSVAWRWPWPALLPTGLSGKAWANAAWASPALATIIIALSATSLALLLALAWLEGEDRAQRRSPLAEALIYLPLLVPQVSFLFGMNILALRLGLGASLIAVIWAHVLFVLPYVMIALAGPWRALDHRYVQTAAALGIGPWRRLVFVKLPLLLAPIMAATAIGIAVSVAQYLPTLFLGAGRIATLTTEAVTLSSSSDRRVLAVVASLQAALPFAGYAAAFLVPAFLFRHRRDMQGAAL